MYSPSVSKATITILRVLSILHVLPHLKFYDILQRINIREKYENMRPRGLLGNYCSLFRLISTFHNTSFRWKASHIIMASYLS